MPRKELSSVVYRYQFRSDTKEKKADYAFKARVWLYPGDAAWHFVTVPLQTSKVLKRLFGVSARGWGSLPVTVVVGSSQWKTSIFPDRKAGTYILPLKSEIRKKEGIKKDSLISLRLTVNL